MVEDNTQAQGFPRWEADTKVLHRKGEAVPYLGPVPPPSRPWGLITQLLLGFAVGVRLANAAVFLWWASIDRRLVTGVDPTVAGDLRRIKALAGSLAVQSLISVVLVIGAEVVWMSKRRPRQVRAARGEAYIESPLNWVQPMWARIATSVPFAVALVVGSGATVTATTPVTDLSMLRTRAALASAMWAVFFVMLILRVLAANRAFEARLAASAPYRQAPESLPYFTPVTEASAASSGTPAGVGWLLRSTGLAAIGMVSFVVLLGGVASVVGGQVGSGAGLTALGLAGCAFVAWVCVRRLRRGAANRVVAAAAPATALR
ncbi:MAG: hypothetical protein HYX34_05965 [Actinobacteria bacterium]|nr:hypothetical protein [Actinomycetota bacterium]